MRVKNPSTKAKTLFFPLGELRPTALNFGVSINLFQHDI